MFLCEKCHPVGLFPDYSLKSLGRCEDCGETAVCNDICIHRPKPEKTMCDDHIHEQAEIKADRQSAVVDEQIKDILSSSAEVERIIAENASLIADLYCLHHKDCVTCGNLIMQQIDHVIMNDAESTTEAREH